MNCICNRNELGRQHQAVHIGDKLSKQAETSSVLQKRALQDVTDCHMLLTCLTREMSHFITLPRSSMTPVRRPDASSSCTRDIASCVRSPNSAASSSSATVLCCLMYASNSASKACGDTRSIPTVVPSTVQIGCSTAGGEGQLGRRHEVASRGGATVCRQTEAHPGLLSGVLARAAALDTDLAEPLLRLRRVCCIPLRLQGHAAAPTQLVDSTAEQGRHLREVHLRIGGVPSEFAICHLQPRYLLLELPLLCLPSGLLGSSPRVISLHRPTSVTVTSTSCCSLGLDWPLRANAWLQQQQQQRRQAAAFCLLMVAWYACHGLPPAASSDGGPVLRPAELGHWHAPPPAPAACFEARHPHLPLTRPPATAQALIRQADVPMADVQRTHIVCADAVHACKQNSFESCLMHVTPTCSSCTWGITVPCYNECTEGQTTRALADEHIAPKRLDHAAAAPCTPSISRLPGAPQRPNMGDGCSQPGPHLVRLTTAACFCCLSSGLPPTPQALLHALRSRLPPTASPLLCSLCSIGDTGGA
jgi:hypothetical protein